MISVSFPFFLITELGVLGRGGSLFWYTHAFGSYFFFILFMHDYDMVSGCNDRLID